MGLRDLVIPTEKVEIPGGDSFAVRGLSPNDALKLYYRHQGELSAFFDLVNQGQVAAAEGVAELVGIALINAAPILVAETIVVASDEPYADEVEFTELVTFAVKLPAGVQMEALQKIARLTFTSDMPAGKFLAVVLQMAASATASLGARKT